MITPQEAYAKAKPDEKVLKNLEEKIDRAIIEGIKSGSEKVYFDTREIPDIASRKEIMQRYRSAGWTVKYESNQRDGDYLIFKKSSNNYSNNSNTDFWDQRDHMTYTAWWDR